MCNGYVVVDCTGLNLLEESEQNISGMFERLDNVMKLNKPIIADNCEWGDGVKITPIPVFCIKFSDDLIIATSSTLQVHVDSNDDITIVNMIQ